MIAVVLEGPAGRRLLDGLVDTGSDRTIFPRREAKSVGLRLPSKVDGSIKTAGGVVIAYRLADVVLELRSGGLIVRWKTRVAFADDPLSIIHLGMRGFLEFFHCTFMGPEERVAFHPCPSLPSSGL
jgi:predicted aspartyl protease